MLNEILKKLIQFILKWLAKIYIKLTDPYVVVISGTTRRLWIKDAVIETLKERSFLVRSNKKNFNAEIGLPLSILNLPVGEKDFRKWIKIIWQAIKIDARLLKKKNFRREYLVLEMAVDTPKDMKYLLSIVKPNAVVMTTVTMIYQENFETLDAVAKEYKELVKALPWNGLLVVNYDDERIKRLKDFYEGKIATYGTNKGAEFQAIDIKKTETGQEFKVEIIRKEKESLSLSIKRFGMHHVYAVLVKEIIKDNFKPQQKDFFDKITQDLKEGN